MVQIPFQRVCLSSCPTGPAVPTGRSWLLLWRFFGLLGRLIFVWDSLFRQTAGRNGNDRRARRHRWVLNQDLQKFPLFPDKAFCWLFRYRQNRPCGVSHHRRAFFRMSRNGIKYRLLAEGILLYQLILWCGRRHRWQLPILKAALHL